MKKKKSIINKLIIVMIIAIISFIGIEIYQEQKLEKEANEFFELSKYKAKQTEQNIENKEPQIKERIYPKTEVMQEYKGYSVCAKIEIPAIELETYVLQKYSKDALNISPTKFWGVNPNEVGNFCVAGHNMRKKNMFGGLKRLNIKDKIIVSDNNIGIVEYEIFNIERVLPANTDCLSQATKGKRFVTLITCTSDSKKRMIIKAREIEK